MATKWLVIQQDRHPGNLSPRTYYYVFDSMELAEAFVTTERKATYDNYFLIEEIPYNVILIKGD